MRFRNVPRKARAAYSVHMTSLREVLAAQGITLTDERRRAIRAARDAAMQKLPVARRRMQDAVAAERARQSTHAA